jgi:lipid A 3-O-deacylase
MISEQPKKRTWRLLIAGVLLAVATSLTNCHGNAQELATHGPWQISVFAAGGFPPNYKVYDSVSYPGGSYSQFAIVRLDLLSAGAQIGKVLSAPRGRGFLRGQGEAVVEVMPFWLAHYPKQEIGYGRGGSSGVIGAVPFGPVDIPGASVTPLLYRWNFTGRASRRSVPWAQLGAGLLWTNHQFPVADPITNANTSVINFIPHGAIGESIFIKKNQSLDFAFKAVHISNAGLGVNNPGLNITLQCSAGYSWWR